MTEHRFDHLIIGNSAAGIGGVEGIRTRDKDATICIVSDEPYHTYSRPLIGEFVAGHLDFGGMVYRPKDYYGKKKVTAMLGVGVGSIDPVKRTAELSNGDTIIFNKALIAIGGKPIVPPMEGGDMNGVLTFVTQRDAEELATRISGIERVVVIGGGLIGVDVAWALVRKGIKVSIVELKDRCLNLILDGTASGMYEARMKEHGVDIHVNNTVKAIRGRPEAPSKVGSVLLSDGTVIECQLVIVAIGVVPSIELPKAAGLRVGRGVVVDDHMMTSKEDIYAAGDVVELYDFAYDIVRPMPILPNAYFGGRVAGVNMARGDATLPATTAMNSMNYFDMDIVSGGIVNFVGDMDPDDYTILSRVDGKNGNYRMFIIRDERILGMTLVGDVSEGGIIYGLMRDRVDISTVKDRLLEPDFTFATLDRGLRKATQKGERPGGMGTRSGGGGAP